MVCGILGLLVLFWDIVLGYARLESDTLQKSKPSLRCSYRPRAYWNAS